MHRDTHYPWKTEDVVEPGASRFEDGSVRVPCPPGPRCHLGRDALARLCEQWRHNGIRTRDDATLMRAAHPHRPGRLPRL